MFFHTPENLGTGTLKEFRFAITCAQKMQATAKSQIGALKCRLCGSNLIGHVLSYTRKPRHGNPKRIPVRYYVCSKNASYGKKSDRSAEVSALWVELDWPCSFIHQKTSAREP